MRGISWLAERLSASQGLCSVELVGCDVRHSLQEGGRMLMCLACYLLWTWGYERWRFWLVCGVCPVRIPAGAPIVLRAFVGYFPQLPPREKCDYTLQQVAASSLCRTIACAAAGPHRIRTAQAGSCLSRWDSAQESEAASIKSIETYKLYGVEAFLRS
jgi:hypothetical protein